MADWPRMACFVPFKTVYHMDMDCICDLAIHDAAGFTSLTLPSAVLYSVATVQVREMSVNFRLFGKNVREKEICQGRVKFCQGKSLK